jgi:transcriptional regulator
MYQPAHGRFVVSDDAAALAEISARIPATLVTLGPDGLRATTLPMLFDPSDGDGPTLRGHLARGNPQWRTFDPDVEALAIFTDPDTYISPSWYEEKRRNGKVVPTWNYVSVHARGRLLLHHEPEWLVPHVRMLVERHEAAMPVPWSIDDAPADYIDMQAKAIVGLELRLTRIEAKRKLSQNRSADDVAGVIEALSTGSQRAQAVAAEMRRDAGGD